MESSIYGASLRRQRGRVPNPLRWAPFPIPDQPLDFGEGLRTIVANGAADANAAWPHMCTSPRGPWGSGRSSNAEGEMLLVRQQGRIIVTTELGVVSLKAGEVALIPAASSSRWTSLMALPVGTHVRKLRDGVSAAELGPIGSNGLANRRAFEAPPSAYEEDTEYEIIPKAGGRLARRGITGSS